MDLDPAHLGDLLSFDPEQDDGNCEYKYKLTDLSEKQMNHLAVQLKYRIDEGFGEAIYEIGLRDDGFPIGITEKAMDETPPVDPSLVAPLCDEKHHSRTQ